MILNLCSPLCFHHSHGDILREGKIEIFSSAIFELDPVLSEFQKNPAEKTTILHAARDLQIYKHIFDSDS